MQFRSSIILCDKFTTLLLVVAKEIFHRHDNTWKPANNPHPIPNSDLTPPHRKRSTMDGLPAICPGIIINQDILPMPVDMFFLDEKEQTLTMIWKIVYGFHELSVPPFQTVENINQAISQSSGRGVV